MSKMLQKPAIAVQAHAWQTSMDLTEFRQSGSSELASKRRSSLLKDVTTQQNTRSEESIQNSNTVSL